ncbi:hypothetical protein K432DRAFT_423561 [Lepidopterella palustris CBS 459.81]|uniref:Zn(2)-C6 fungal-type domain-containing protein n=1 Tax=Lepidopterella palustris CBS 459.81 TaxID=1314670 RepID=A0A8E2EFQ4_9PEZI|nr:hypothetical protein K432DRAFT_423561 [Lepidopterella palustris CBS 459.81]
MALDSAKITFFHVSPTRLDGSGPDLQDVNGRSCRQRRRHPKSKKGCQNCKKRKVKCDETLPACRNCVKRKAHCSLQDDAIDIQHTQQSRNSELERPLTQTEFCDGLSADVNMLQMKLFHHFGALTARTLIFGAEVWRNKVMVMSFKHDFLMHAILVVSATHLDYLDPHNPINRKASVFHLSKALQLFRHELSQPLTKDNADPLMATAILLFHHAWANIDFVYPSFSFENFNPDDPSSYSLDLSMDPVFTLASGVRDLFMSAMSYLTSYTSIFSVNTFHRPPNAIIRAAGRSTKAAEEIEMLLKQYFFGIRNTSTPPSSQVPLDDFHHSLIETIVHTPDPEIQKAWIGIIERIQPAEESNEDDRAIFSAYMEASNRLSPLLSLCGSQTHKGGIGSEDLPSMILPSPSPDPVALHQSIVPDIARYFFSFPVRSLPVFNTLVRQNDPRAYMVLLYFYRSMRSLVPSQTYWWSRPRADFMEKAIHSSLLARGYGPLMRAKELAFVPGRHDYVDSDVVRKTLPDERPCEGPSFLYCALPGEPPIFSRV